MQNLAGGYVLKDLTHPRELWMPVPGNIHAQAGQGSAHPDLDEDVLADCRRVGLGGLYRSLSTQNILGFHGASQPDCGNSCEFFPATV